MKVDKAHHHGRRNSAFLAERYTVTASATWMAPVPSNIEVTAFRLMVPPVASSKASHARSSTVTAVIVPTPAITKSRHGIPGVGEMLDIGADSTFVAGQGVIGLGVRNSTQKG